MTQSTASIASRLEALHASLDERIAKRVPRDGDGDGILNEGRKPKGGGAGRGRRMEVNIGSAKYPMMAPQGKPLPKKDADGFTHRVPGFKAPVYSGQGRAGGGDFAVSINSKAFTFNGKQATHTKSGKQVYNFSGPEGSGQRMWVAADGRAYVD